MKSIFKQKFSLIGLFLVLCLTIGLILIPPQKTYAQDLFENEVVTDNNFTMTMTVNARKQNGRLNRIEQTITNKVGEEITFLCFNWRDLENFKFNISSNIANQSKNYTSLKFLVTYIESETLNESIGLEEPDSPLYETLIYNNNFNDFDYYYYIDEDSSTTPSTTHSNGHGFGLYKFDCIYTYQDEGSSVDVSTGNLGGIYIAVLPDKVEDVVENNIKIFYSISSSNKLMNIFRLYLSTDDYKYVNPHRLQWNVVGTDKNNINYVLTKQIQQENIGSYANHRFIYESLEASYGNTFIFDSKDIEGTWTAYCTITNSDGSIKNVLQVSNLSTIKVEKKSYMWLIFLILVICLVLAGIISIIVIKKKKDKVW